MWWQLMMIPLHLVRTMSQGTPPSAQRGRCRRGDVPANVASDVTNTTPAAFLHGVDDDNNSQKARRPQNHSPTHDALLSFLPRSETLKSGEQSLLTSTQVINQFPHCEAASDLRNKLSYTVHTQRTATIMNALHRNRHNLLT